jgi:hypothetical protein
MARKKAKQEISGIVIAIPKDDVNVLIQALEDRLDDIVASECDCDDCARDVAVLGEIVEKIIANAPMEKT